MLIIIIKNKSKNNKNSYNQLMKIIKMKFNNNDQTKIIFFKKHYDGIKNKHIM